MESTNFSGLVWLCSARGLSIPPFLTNKNKKNDADEKIQGPENNSDGDGDGLESWADQAVVKVGQQVVVEPPVEGAAEAGDETEGDDGHQDVENGEGGDRNGRLGIVVLAVLRGPGWAGHLALVLPRLSLLDVSLLVGV